MGDLRATRSTRFAQLVGLELKGEFAKHGYSQGKVADELGHSRGGYSKWINAKPSMPMEAFLNTCELIDVDPRNVMDAAYSRLIEEMGPVQSEPNTQPPAGGRLSDSFVDASVSLSDEERTAITRRKLEENPMSLAALHDPNKKIEMMGEAGPDWDEPA